MLGSKTVSVYDYFSLLRTDHWFKNIFIFPGFCLAYFFSVEIPGEIVKNVCFGLISACVLVSANYVINEWLDRNFDQYHPTKKYRVSVQKNLKAREVYAGYVVLVVLGLFLAWQVNLLFFLSGSLLLVMGVLYNVQPFRLKDRLYLDVISESVNHPIRFLLGWAMVVPTDFPPMSALLAYWMGGAFLMGIKRYAEFCVFQNSELASRYRLSLGKYSKTSLLVSSFFYALSSSFFLGVFLIKYRVEYVALFPFLAVLFAWYLKLGLHADSTAQCPEKLYREKGFVLYVVCLAFLAWILTFIEIDILHLLYD